MTNPGSVHILLADDDDEDQELLKEALVQEESGVDISSVWNGEELLSYLSNCPDDTLPCLILLDYKMPILNGPEVLDRLCQDARYESIPKAVWSTSSQQEYIDNCLGKGAVRFFTKPNNPSDLRKMAIELLSFCRHAG